LGLIDYHGIELVDKYNLARNLCNKIEGSQNDFKVTMIENVFHTSHDVREGSKVKNSSQVNDKINL
jgi:hypothetical protein